MLRTQNITIADDRVLSANEEPGRSVEGMVFHEVEQKVLVFI